MNPWDLDPNHLTTPWRLFLAWLKRRRERHGRCQSAGALRLQG